MRFVAGSRLFVIHFVKTGHSFLIKFISVYNDYLCCEIFPCMLNRYWREYPIFLQLILLLLLVYILMSFSGVIILTVVGKVYHVAPKAITGLGPGSDSNAINAGRFAQLVGNLLTFMASALLFANFTHPKPFAYLGLNQPSRPVRFIIVALLALAFIPLAEQTGAWMHLVDLGKDVKAAQDVQDATYKAFLRMNTPSALLQVLFIMAVIPAIGEELLFRGVLMRYTYKSTRNIGLSVLVSAALFAFVHGTVFNFPSILLAGIILGYIYYITGSIWFSILFHFVNNGVQILTVYLAQHKMLPAQLGDMEQYPLYAVIIAAVVVAGCILLLRKQATPLPARWGEDFEREPIAENESSSQS